MSPRKEAPQQKFAATLKAMPARPGVYIFKGAKAKILYVGKAQVLRTRVRSYFGSTHAFEPKVRQLVDKIEEIEFILTASALEALLL
jgi:excinuclease ABC subunit C